MRKIVLTRHTEDKRRLSEYCGQGCRFAFWTGGNIRMIPGYSIPKFI